MRCEIPVLLRCCFCIPLRRGLLVWAYLKQAFSLFFLVVMCWRTYVINTGWRRTSVLENLIAGVVIAFIVVDVAFHVLFIVSAHTKDYKNMRVFYRYGIVTMCLLLLLICVHVGTCAFYLYMAPILVLFLWSFILPALVLTILLLFIQGYLVILVRSEFMKLKNNSQFEFVNHAADEKCVANLDFVKDIPTTV